MDLRSGQFQVHVKGLELQKRKLYLVRKHAELQEETSSPLSATEMRDRLLQRVKVGVLS